jgi:hypothetical protein
MLLDLQLNRFKGQLKIRKSAEGKFFIFDPIRKKELVLLPEEFVRQLIIIYFNTDLSISLNRIQVEKQLIINKMTKRYDIIVYDSNYSPILLVECKSYKIKLNQNTFRQIAAYNLKLKVPFLLISNGIESYLCEMDYENKKFSFLDHFPNLK